MYLGHKIQEINVRVDQKSNGCSKLQCFISQLAVKANFDSLHNIMQFYANVTQQPQSVFYVNVIADSASGLVKDTQQPNTINESLKSCFYALEMSTLNMILNTWISACQGRDYSWNA